MVSETQRWIKSKRKPQLPSRTEPPTMGLVSDKNYVAMNAVEAILSSRELSTENSPRGDTSENGKLKLPSITFVQHCPKEEQQHLRNSPHVNRISKMQL